MATSIAFNLSNKVKIISDQLWYCSDGIVHIFKVGFQQMTTGN